MNDALLESLLNEDENSSLDFKSQQYPFSKASDAEKGELVKDILAMANAWRRTDAFILIGVEEVKGGRSKVVGVTKHLDDASLQQLVNSKVQRPVVFSYEAYPFEAKQLGILHIPAQERPFYLIKSFGGLTANIVYIRRGSSTGEASLDEVAKMGIAKQDDINSHIELMVLLEELELFHSQASKVRPIEQRVRFGFDQYQRLFDKGVITRLEPRLRTALREVYLEIKTLDEIIAIAWNNARSNVWAMNVNEATGRLSVAKMKATTAISFLKQYLTSFHKQS